MAFIRNVDKLIEGLENKFFTEARARAAVAPDIAAEQSRAQAAESAEQSARVAADNQLQSNINAEQSARQSADNALSGRLDVVEGTGNGSIKKSLQDAKDYADLKVSNLINGAPGALDTLKEIADQLANDESAVGALTNTVASNLVEAKSYADQKVSEEASARQSAISSEQSARQSAISAEQSARELADQALDGRLDVLEQDPTTKTYVDGKVSMLQGSISQEVLDLEGMLSAEESARQLADNNLSGRIAVLEQDPTTKQYVDGEVSDLQGQITQEISDRQSAVSSEQSRAESAEQALDGRIDVLEQDPTTKTYVDGKVSMLEGEISQEISDRQSAISSEQSRAQAAEGLLDGRLDVLEQDPTTKTYVDGKVVMLQGEVDSEESRAMAAEGALDGRLDILEQDPTTKTYVDGEVQDLQGQISQEISDRQSAVSNEASVRQMADNALDARLDVLEQDPTTKSYVDSQINQEVSDRQADVNAEESRAMSAEAALDGRLDILEQDPVTKTYVDGEVSDLQGQVNTEKGRIDAILSASDADKDSFAEIVQLINSVDTSNDNAFAAYVLSNNAALAQEISDRQADVNAEESRAMAAEGLLDGRLDVLETDPTTKTYVDGQISSERSARQSADSALSSRIGVLELDPVTKAYVNSADTALQNNINGLFASKTTSDLAEGTRLYYTQARFDSAFAAKSTSDLSEGSRLYFTDARAKTAAVVNSSAGSQTDQAMSVSTGKAYADSAVASEASLRSAEDLTMFKKDGSRAMTGQFQAIDGTVAAPGISFGSGTNTGIYKTGTGASQIMWFALNGANKITADSLGSAISGRLQMSGSSAINIVWSVDGAGDIGASGASRPNNLYVKNSIVNSGSESIGTTLTMAGASGANMLWTTDGGGDIGASAVNRPNNLYVKNNGTFGGSIAASNGTLTTATGAVTVNGLAYLNGPVRHKYVAVSASTSLSVITHYIVAVTDLSASRVMTLPVAGSSNPSTQAYPGQVMIIKDISGAASQSNYIQILPQSGQTIDGQADYKIVMPYESVMLVSNGTNWFIV